MHKHDKSLKINYGSSWSLDKIMQIYHKPTEPMYCPYESD